MILAHLLGTVASYPIVAGPAGSITTHQARGHVLLNVPKNQIITRDSRTQVILGMPNPATIATHTLRAYAIVFP